MTGVSLAADLEALCKKLREPAKGKPGQSASVV
jgi:hypothetical protein